MLFKFIYHISFIMMVAVCVYYTFLYSQMSEDIHEIKKQVKKCDKKPKAKETVTP